MQWTGSSGDFPSEFEWEGITIELLNFGQLEQMSRMTLKNRVTTMREHIAAQQPGTRLPPLSGFGPDMTIAWLLKVQVALARSVGIRITESDLGALSENSSGGTMADVMSKPRAIAVDQHENFDQQHMNYDQQSYQQQMYSQQGYSQGYRQKGHDGFQSKSAQDLASYEPAQMKAMYDAATADASYTANQARARNQSSFTFG